MLLTPNVTNHCFGCGGANARGMQLTFEQDDATRRIRGMFRIPADFQGGAGIVHGGIVALLLDEVMSKLNRFQSDRAVTGELSVKYVKPVPVDEEIIVEGWETERNGRKIVREGEIRDTSGVVLARGRAVFISVDPERYRSPEAAIHAQKH
jgi:uncharacterized protein (TIGR00369 family)